MASLTTRVRVQTTPRIGAGLSGAILREMKWNPTPPWWAGLFYVSSYDDYLYCLNATTGVQVWNFNTGEFIYSSPAVAGGCVVRGERGPEVLCLNATTGALIGNFTTGGAVDPPRRGRWMCVRRKYGLQCVLLGRNHGGADLELQHGRFRGILPRRGGRVRVCWN